MLLVLVDLFRDLRRTGGEFAVALGAVAVELDMGQVHGTPLDRIHGPERGVQIAGYAEIHARAADEARPVPAGQWSVP